MGKGRGKGRRIIVELLESLATLANPSSQALEPTAKTDPADLLFQTLLKF